MDDDDVAPDELLPGPELLATDPAVMGDHLEIEMRDEGARVALARRRLLDIAEPTAELEVTALDRVLELRRVDDVGDRVDERGVALELRELEGRAKSGDDRAHQVGEDVLGMVELGAGEEPGVAADIGDDQAGGFGLVEHRFDVPAGLHHRPSTAACHGSRRGLIRPAIRAG